MTTLTPREAWEKMRNVPHLKRVRDGDLDPGPWFHAEPDDGSGLWGQWGIKAEPGQRGLTLLDLMRAGDEPPPEEGFDTGQVRGAGMDAEMGLMRIQYPANKRYQVWSDNVLALFEEGVSRQWSATQDIPWERLTPLPKEMEKALCHICTFLTRVEFGAADRLGPWLQRIGYAFHEVKMFLGTQIMDETRHMDVFRKRALANGGGLGCSFGTSTSLETADTPIGLDLKLIFSDFNTSSFLIHVVGEGMVLDIFRFSEFLGQNEVDKIIFQRVMQDEARHVSFGAMRLKYFLEHCPDREGELEKLHAVADQLEMNQTVYLLLNPHLLQASAILAGGGTGGLDKGYEAYRKLYLQVRESYLRRCDIAEFSRRDRCVMPPEPPF
ncbi:MAG: ferritin-like domain-containing protein [Dehalococcoidia bacterium]